MLLAMCVHVNRVKQVADGEVNSQLFSNFLLLDFEQGLKLICVKLHLLQRGAVKRIFLLR